MDARRELPDLWILSRVHVINHYDQLRRRPIRAAATPPTFVTESINGQKAVWGPGFWMISSALGGRLQCEERAGFRQSGRVLASC